MHVVHLLLLTLACNPNANPAEGSFIGELDPTDVAHPTGQLVGFNLGRGTYYAAEDDPFHPEWRTDQRRQAIEALSLFQNPGGQQATMRFSGLQIDGTLGGDGYHFQDFVRQSRGSVPSDNMSTFEYMTLMREANAKPVVMLNFGSGTAQEAGEYATHLNGADGTDPNVQMRTHWGDIDPYGVEIFEVGNESYGFWNTGYSATGDHSYANPGAAQGGDALWHGKPSSTPEDYAARALTYIQAVQQSTPDARFWIPLSQADMEGWGGPAESVPRLAAVLENPAVEAVVIHHYQVDDSRTLGFEDSNDPAIVLAGSRFLEPGYLELFEVLEGVNREEPLQVAITEWGVAGFFAPPDFTLGRTTAMGLGTADALISFSRWGIDHAQQHVALWFGALGDEILLEEWYQPFRFSEGQRYWLPRTRVYKLFADHLLQDTLTLDLTGGLELVGGDGSDARPLFSYDAVHATAFVDADQDEMTVVLLNRDVDDTHPVRLYFPDEGWYVADANTFAPWQWQWDAWVTTPGHDPDVGLTIPYFRQQGGLVDLELPRGSVVAIRLIR